MASPKNTAFQMILDWAAGKPAWQQDALRRIVQNESLTESDIQELADLSLKAQGETGIEIVPDPITSSHVPIRISHGRATSLLSLSGVANVNRLAGGQTLPFGETGLTIVYGDNGAGKSGYSRVLKRACKARAQEEIQPNAFETSSGAAASAEITYAVGGVPLSPVHWTDDGQVVDALSTVNVFDRASAAILVREQNGVAFRPFGLDVPDELASACQRVKDALTEKQKALNSAQDAAFVVPQFSASTPVGKILSSLSAKTDISELRSMSLISEGEENRYIRLCEDLARDPFKAAAEHRAKADALRQFADQLDSILSTASDDVFRDLDRIKNEARSKREAARLAAEVAFGGAPVNGVGGALWRAMWESARRYAEQEVTPGEAYPQAQPEGAPCILCHQPLAREAQHRLIAFDEFVKDDIEQQAQAAEALLEAFKTGLLSMPVKIASFPLRRQLAVSHPILAKAILRSLATARYRKCGWLRAPSEQASASWPAMPESPLAALRQVAAETASYAEQIERSADPKVRSQLESERDALRDRKLLSSLLPKVEIEIHRLATLQRVAKCVSQTSTRGVTDLGNSIADEVVTSRFRDRFQEEIQKLAATRVRVDLVRSGGKFGSPNYRVQLFASEKAKVHSVLSEGEQTCVALAAFLTELATEECCSPLVFDDPVSSLDHRWRRKVAERLIEEAASRQIIVFSHDLVFVNDLQDLAEKRNIPCKEVSLHLRDKKAGVVTEGVPWASQKIRARIDALEKQARSAREHYEKHDDAAYGDAASDFFNKLRSSWERALEDVAFCGVIHRHRDYINAKDLRKVVALEAADVATWANEFDTCCDFIDAHDPSRGRNAPPPPPGDLLQHVEKLKIWVEALRSKQQMVA